MRKGVKFTGWLMVLLLMLTCIPLIGVLAAGGAADAEDLRQPIDSRKHLILDENNNYGGTLNKALYGEGAPKNGEYDVEDSEYWMVNDYYNMTSTDERTVIPHFAPYQQTMADSSGLACALMILNHDGKDVSNEWNELALVEKYQELNNTTVYGNGTDAEGLAKLFGSLGYTTRDRDYKETSSSRNENIDNFVVWVKNHLDNGRFVMVRYEDGVDNGWKIIFGIDLMEKGRSRNAVLMMANPNDGADHFQDGYSFAAAGRFYRWWFDVEHDGSRHDNFDYLVVAPQNLIEIEKVEEERVPVQEMPENHLLRNADGSYGGTRDAAKYGTGTPLNGEVDEPNSPYHKFVDYYNMTSNDTRLMLTHYRAYSQTMASSCGICSTMSVLAYYGYDVTDGKTGAWNEVFLVDTYEDLNDKVIYNVGVGGSGLKKLVTQGLGFASSDYKSYASSNYVSDEESMIFATYEEFITWAKANLSKGTPMPISHRPHGGHWEVIIGYDDMGTDYIYDDVLVLADSGDSWDHYQDGYNTYAATQFFAQWYNGSFTYNQQYNVFDNVLA